MNQILTKGSYRICLLLNRSCLPLEHLRSSAKLWQNQDFPPKALCKFIALKFMMREAKFLSITKNKPYSYILDFLPLLKCVRYSHLFPIISFPGPLRYLSCTLQTVQLVFHEREFWTVKTCLRFQTSSPFPLPLSMLYFQPDPRLWIEFGDNIILWIALLISLLGTWEP